MVNGYIQTLEEDTLSEYPLEIQSTTMDLSSMMASMMGGSGEESGEVTVSQMLTNLFSKVEPNDLESLKAYFDSGASGIDQYAHAIEYSYDVAPQIYQQKSDNSVRQVNPDHSFAALGIGSDSNSFMSSMMNTDVFYQMPENAELYQDQYEVKAGRWPERYNECVVVLTSRGQYQRLYALYPGPAGLGGAGRYDPTVFGRGIGYHPG